MFWILYAISIGVLYWVYDGYGRFLKFAVAIRSIVRKRHCIPAVDETDLPDVTVLLTVHNERDTVQRRITDVLSGDYPREKLQILVASDGSTDGTNEIVRDVAATQPQVVLFESEGLGKTATQNLALQQIASEIVVFTDADIRFDSQFLRNVAIRFADPRVGAVDGRLTYGSDSSDPLAQGQGYYWRYEHMVRHLESELGVLAVVAGACFAVRRHLVMEMDPAIGEDCIVPLDVVSQGALVIHEPSAVAWDRFDEGNAFALRRRIRMTLRNWQGTWTRPRLLNPFVHPGYAFALWSHKLLRWLSPVFVTGALTASVALVLTTGTVAAWMALSPLIALLVLGACGWSTPRTGIRIPGAGTAFGFLLANLAFLLGITRAIAGQRIRRYQKVG